MNNTTLMVKIPKSIFSKNLLGKVAFWTNFFVILLFANSTAADEVNKVLDARFVKANPTTKGKVAPILKVEFELQKEQVDPAKLVAEQDAAGQPKVAAAKAVRFGVSDKDLLLVVLIQGETDWMGNDTYKGPKDVDEEGYTVYNKGAYKGAKEAIAQIGTIVPAKGSKAGHLLVYGNNVKSLFSGPITDKDSFAAKLGTQEVFAAEEYSQVHLAKGIREAKGIFSDKGTPETRQILLVIGSGEVLSAKTDLDSIKSMCSSMRKNGVEIFTIQYQKQDERSKDKIPQNQELMRAIAGVSANSQAADKPDDIGSITGNFAERIKGQRYYVEFPGEQFVNDSKEHIFVFNVDGDELNFEDSNGDPKKILTFKWSKPSSGGGSLWWLWFIVIPMFVILLLLLIVAAAKPAPQEVYMQEQPMEEPDYNEPPVIPTSVNADGHPIVGWIVPLNGPQQFQTMQLWMGENTVGAAPNARITVADQYMSDVHAKIICTAQGFSLEDANSKNGVSVLGDRLVGRHELIDNDMFRMGETDFKFKTIN